MKAGFVLRPGGVVLRPWILTAYAASTWHFWNVCFPIRSSQQPRAAYQTRSYPQWQCSQPQTRSPASRKPKATPDWYSCSFSTLGLVSSIQLCYPTNGLHLPHAPTRPANVHHDCTPFLCGCREPEFASSCLWSRSFIESTIFPILIFSFLMTPAEAAASHKCVGKKDQSVFRAISELLGSMSQSTCQ